MPCMGIFCRSSYTITECTDKESRGTSIKLFLKPDQEEYLQEHTLKNIIKKHSQYVGYPISLLVEKSKEEEETEGEEAAEGEKPAAEGEDDDVKIEDAEEDK